MAIQLDPSIVQTRADALAAARRHCFEEAGRQHVAPVRQHPLAVAVVQLMLEDVAAGEAPPLDQIDASSLPELLDERGVQYVTFEDWKRIDAAEIERGRARGASRIKFSRISEMLEVVGKSVDSVP